MRPAAVTSSTPSWSVASWRTVFAPPLCRLRPRQALDVQVQAQGVLPLVRGAAHVAGVAQKVFAYPIYFEVRQIPRIVAQVRTVSHIQ